MLATKINDTIVISGRVQGVELSHTYIGITIWEALKLFVKEATRFEKQRLSK